MKGPKLGGSPKPWKGQRKKKTELLDRNPIPAQAWRFAELWQKEVGVSALAGSSVLKYYLWQMKRSTAWFPNDVDLFTVAESNGVTHDEDWLVDFLYRNQFTYDNIECPNDSYWADRFDSCDTGKISGLMNVMLAEQGRTAFRMQIICIKSEEKDSSKFGEAVVGGFDIDICKGFIVPDGGRTVTWLDETMSDNALHGRFDCRMENYPSFRRLEKYIRRGFRPSSLSFARDIVLKVRSTEVSGGTL